MKKIIGLFAILLAFAIQAEAQEMYKDVWLYQGTTFKTATDSTNLNVNMISAAGVTQAPQYTSQLPDSVGLVWYGYGGTTGDSIGLIFQYRFQFSSAIQSGATGKFTMTTLDSITAQAYAEHTLPVTSRYANTASFYVVPITTGHNDAASTSAFPSTLYAKLRFWYHPAR